MSQSLLFSLVAPSQNLERAKRVFLLLLLGFVIVVAVDLIGDGQLHGRLGIYAVQTLVVTAPLAITLRAVAGRLRRMQHRLDGVENRDPLTATYNRHAFMRHATDAAPQGGALLMLDVDQLSLINQRLGYDAGDLCLMALAMKFREVVRGTDITGRMDSTTFAIYMPAVSMEDAAMIAVRLKEGIQMTTAEGLLHVTVSVGAVAVDGVTPVKTLMRDAQIALEQAKRAGRGGLILQELRSVA